MTRKRFTKLLRSIGISTDEIKICTDRIINLGGEISYKEFYDILNERLIQSIIQSIIFDNAQPKINLIPFKDDFEDNQFKCHLTHGAKVANPSCVFNVSFG